MIRTNVVHITLSCALLLLPAACGRAWAADSGLNWSRSDDGTYHTPSRPNENHQVGSYSETGTASGGEVKIYTGNRAWIVYGGGANGANNDATNNSVTMYSGTVAAIYGGADTNGSVSHNTVKVYDGIVRGGVAGGYTAGNGNADYNSVEIHKCAVYDNVLGGFSQQGSANYNTIRIQGGTIGKDTKVLNIIGGQIDGASSGTAENNTVILSGVPVFVGDTGIYGGIVGDGKVSQEKAFTGNTLILDRYRGKTTAGPIANFQYFGFTLDENSQPIKSKSVLFGINQNPPSSVTFINSTGSYAPEEGKDVTLIHAGHPAPVGGFVDGEVTGNKLGGANAVTYKWNVRMEVDQSQNKTLIIATLREKIDNGIYPHTKSLLEGRMGGTVALTQAADMTAGQGMSAMLASVSQRSFSTWGAMGGGTSRYSTGSHISTHGIGFMIGAAWRKHTGLGTLALSPFFAFGRGNYTSHNAFAGVGSVKGKGNTNYEGGGLMARYGHTNTGWYGEASFQLGHVKQDFKTHDFLDNHLNYTKYAISQRYTGLHFGIGKEIAFSSCSVLDVYGKYFWTHTGKKTADVSGDIYEFAAVNSHRARFGARYTYTAATGIGEVKPYAGAAYEYEFNGKGRGMVNGYRIEDTRLQGSTGLLEAGIGYAPTSQNWALNGGVTGFLGKRRGIMGQLGARADF